MQKSKVDSRQFRAMSGEPHNHESHEIVRTTRRAAGLSLRIRPLRSHDLYEVARSFAGYHAGLNEPIKGAKLDDLGSEGVLQRDGPVHRVDQALRHCSP
jgi:hypothetical protein